MQKPKILVAGATGYLGHYVVQELKKRNHWVRVLLRKAQQKERFKDIDVDEFYVGEITKPETLIDVAKDIDWVFTSIGITRQKDGLTYMDVDYQGNLNLLQEALKAKVSRFQYISAIHADKMREVKILDAKEKFVAELKASAIDYSVIRPNGFFSDMLDFMKMAKGGRVYLFGDGMYKLNPIHGADLADFCVSALENRVQEVEVGGPDILTQKEIGILALEAMAKPIKITLLPDGLRKCVIWALRTFTNPKIYGPYEFFLSATAQDHVATTHGNYHLKDFFIEEAKKLSDA